MDFPKEVRLEALIACQRICCLCQQRKHTRIVCHHIVQNADDGPGTFENCIPLCPDCHAEVLAFNARHHPGATQYYPEELRRRRDQLYATIERRSRDLETKLHRNPAAYPHHPASRGSVSFDYSHFDGFYQIGEGLYEFLSRWTKAGSTAIYCYRDGTNVSVALAPLGWELNDIRDASSLHFESRVQKAQLNQIVILENHTGRYAALKITRIQDNKRGPSVDLLAFDYWILEDGSDDFSTIV